VARGRVPVHPQAVLRVPVHPQAALPVQVHPEAVLPALLRLVAVVRVGVVPDKGGPARGARPEAAAVSAAHVEDKRVRSST